MLTRRQSQRRDLSRVVQKWLSKWPRHERHASRQVPSWLIFDVRQNQSEFMESNSKGRAIEAVKDRIPDAIDIHATGSVSGFLEGELIVVGFKKDGLPHQNYVYIGSGQTVVYGSAEEMARASTLKREKKGDLFLFGLNDVLEAGGIAGVIALLIAATLCYVVVKHPDTEIPEVLSNALSVILGFYFGSKVTGKHA